MKKKKPIFLWISGLCIISMLVVTVKEITIGNVTTSFSTADLIIFFVLCAANFLSWHKIGEMEEEIKARTI